MIVSLLPTDFIADFFLHEYYHLSGFVFEFVEEPKQDGGGDVVGDISNYGIRIHCWNLFQYISLDNRKSRFIRNNQIFFIDPVV